VYGSFKGREGRKVKEVLHLTTLGAVGGKHQRGNDVVIGGGIRGIEDEIVRTLGVDSGASGVDS
jgi:hypothetical protein